MAQDSRYAVIDIETTGLRVDRSRIVEIGIVGLDDQRHPTSEWHSLVHPGRSVGATRIHGIDSTMIDTAPPFASILPTLLSLLEGRVLVAHNAAFDRSFLDHEMRRCGIRLMGGAICTLALARQAGLPRDLMGCATRLGIKMPEHHRALNDARATAAVFAQMAGWGVEDGIRPLAGWPMPS